MVKKAAVLILILVMCAFGLHAQGNVSITGDNHFTGQNTMSSLNNIIFVDGVTYPKTGAGLLSCVAAAGVGGICDARSVQTTQNIASTVTLAIGETLYLGSNTWTSSAANMFAFTGSSNFATAQGGRIYQEPGGVLQYTGTGALFSIAPGGAGNYINDCYIDVDTLDGNALGAYGIQFGGAGWVQRCEIHYKHLWHFITAAIDMQLGRKNGNNIWGGDIDGSNIAATATNSTNCVLIEDSSGQSGYNLYEANAFRVRNIRNCLQHVIIPIQAAHNYFDIDSNFDYVSQATVSNNSGTISNVPNISNWATGDQIWDSGGAIVAGTTVTVSGSNLNLSQNTIAAVTADNFYNPKYYLMAIKGSHNIIHITGMNPWFNYTAPGTPVAGTQPFLPTLWFDTSLYGQDNQVVFAPEFIAGINWLTKAQGGTGVPFDNQLTSPPFKNLLRNGSFEDQSGTYPIGWSPTQMANVISQTAAAVHGSYAVNLVANANQQAILAQNLPTSLNGSTVIGCAWIRWNAGTAGTVGISLADGTGETFMPLPPSAAVGNGDPGNFYYMCVSRTLAANPQFRIYAQHGTGTLAANTIYADGAGVYLGTTPTLPGDVVGDQGNISPTSISLANPFSINVAPTITGHFNTSGDSISANNGTIAMTVTVGTGTAGSTGTIGLPTAANGWNCPPPNNKNRAAYIQMSSSTATSATFTNYGTTIGTPVNWTNSDVLVISCFAY